METQTRVRENMRAAIHPARVARGQEDKIVFKVIGESEQYLRNVH
jgi:hypothetical protein